MFRALKNWILGEAGWLILLAVMAVGAVVYVHVRQVTADRDDLLAWARLACANAGQDFDAAKLPTADAKGRKVIASYKRGELCRIHVTDLAKFQADTVAASAKVLADAQVDHEKKAASDGDSATRNTQAQRAATRKMETENAKVQPDDRVAGDWFGALGDLAGLQPRRD